MLDKQWALNLPNIAPNIASQVLIFSIDTRILWVTWEMPVCFGCYVMLVFIHLSSVLVDTKVKDAWRAWSARGWRRCARQLMALRLARRPEVQQQFFCNGYNWHVAWVVVSTSSQSKLLWREGIQASFWAPYSCGTHWDSEVSATPPNYMLEENVSEKGSLNGSSWVVPR